MIFGCQMQIFRISYFMQPIADKGKKSLFLNAARGRRGRVSFLMQTSIYQARYGEQVCTNLERFFKSINWVYCI